MPNQIMSRPELHTFPVEPEIAALDFVSLAEQARARHAGGLAATDLEYSPVLSDGSNEVYVKRADRLPGGNFKYLSAMNAVAQLIESGRNDFALATAGSYGIGVGHAIQAFGGQATAFVPKDSNADKLLAMRQMGVDTREYGSNFDESLEEARRFAKANDVELLHPFADTRNFGGTGVLGLELLEQCPDMDYLVTQYGGGSLTCGVGGVVKQELPEVDLVVAQARACDPFIRSLSSGQSEQVADPLLFGKSFFKKLGGLGVGKTDPMTLGLGSRLIDLARGVDIDDVYGTMYDFRQAHGVMPETAAAHGLEAARQLSEASDVKDAKIVTMLTGANPDEYREGYLEAMSRRRADKRGGH